MHRLLTKGYELVLSQKYLKFSKRYTHVSLNRSFENLNLLKARTTIYRFEFPYLLQKPEFLVEFVRPRPVQFQTKVLKGIN